LGTKALVNLADILSAGILVVDDKEINVTLIERMLRGAGYTSVESTTHPDEVCELYRKNRYSLILLDLQMPGMDGFEVMEGLKEIEATGYLPVLVITAQPGDKLRALAAGARDFIGKPFEQAEFLARVHNSLEVRLLHIETKNYSQALEETVKDLERSNTDLERFAFVASHDLQEPLRMVTCFSQLLALSYKGQLDAQADEYLEYIQTGTKRMAALIEDLLSYSQIVHATEKDVPVDCNTVLDNVLESSRVMVADNGAVITSDPLPTVDGDEGQIGQLFHNLLTNALKYRKREVAPHVHISAQRTANEWVFSFRDNGIGIASEYWEQVFLIFKRLHKKADYPGTGIGLALCRRIIEGRAGRIWLESMPGVGSTFYFTWPGIEGAQSSG